MRSKESAVKIISLLSAAALFSAGFVMFYLRNDKESGQVSRESVTAGSVSSTQAVSSSDVGGTDGRVYPIDINKATADDLMSVDGIGGVTAGRVIDYRTEKGMIHDIAELSQVEGIGDELCALIGEYFYVDESDFVKFTTSAKVTSTAKAKTTTASSATARRTTTTRKTTTAATTQKADFPLDINKVTRDELMQIDGVGEGLADKIIAFRRSNGKITDMQQLTEIYGIGDSTLDLLCRYLYVDKADYSKVTSATSVTAATAAAVSSEAVTKATTASASVRTTAKRTASVQTVTEPREKRRVNINEATAEEIADALLIEQEDAEMIVMLRELIQGYSNTLELLYLEDYDKRYDKDFYNEIKDYVYV